MIRVFKLKTPALALVASVIAEAVFVVTFFAFRSFTYFGDPMNLISWIFLQFHMVAVKGPKYVGELIPSYWQNVVSTHTTDTCTMMLVFMIGVFQWYIVFFLTVGAWRFMSGRLSNKPLNARIFFLAPISTLLLLSVFLNVYLCWEIYGTIGWREHVLASVSEKASREASDDFRKNLFRLYRIGEAKDVAKHTGTNDGPFEIWNAAFFPSFVNVERYSTEKFTKYYNENMSNKYFLATEKKSKGPSRHYTTNNSPNDSGVK